MPANKTKAAAERQEIDPVFKDVLTFNFRQLDVPIQTQVEVSRLPRTMDALVILKLVRLLEKVRLETVFSYFRVYNQVEFKGKEDPLTRAGYRLILGRTNLYLGEEDISAKEMTVTIISARKPRKVLYQCPDDVRWEKVGTGHYVSTDNLPVHLFVCNELVIEPKNYPLLLFAASKEKFRQFVEQIVEEDNTILIQYAHFMDYKLTEEVLEMAGKQSTYQKNIELYMKKYGKVLLRGLSLEERLRGLTEEDLRGLDPETREKLKQLIKNQDEKQS
ncbi:hypothetical protein H8E77_19755 [bacterium]|nr:hypothetical protein [bacterium]